MTGQRDLFGAHARRRDPATSHAAAESVTPKLTITRRALLKALRLLARPVTDHEIARYYPGIAQNDGLPGQSPSGLRTRRKELVDLGLVRDSGWTATLPSGRKATLWELVP